MKKTMLISFALACTLGASAQLQKMTFMPAWTPQAQFAGYYVAKDLGFFEEEGIDLTIEHMGINSAKPGIVRIAEGEVDIIESHPIQALLARDIGTNVKNVCQIAQNTGMMLVSHEPIDSLKSLEGKKIGRWQSGFSEICEISCIANDLHVNWVPFLNGINLFISGAIDASVVMSYNEYNLLIEAMGEIPQENVIRFADFGYDIPEDGLYVTEQYLAQHPEAVDGFCRAAKRGWTWCLDHREEAIDIVMKWTKEAGIRTNRYHQRLMLDGMLDLLKNPRTGEVDYASIDKDKFDTLVNFLVQLNYISEPVSYKEFFK